VHRSSLKILVLTLAMMFAAAGPSAAADPLPSWKEGKAKRSIVEFVETVTTPGSKGFVPEPERIAVFDNDGTLWAEQQMYFLAFFVFDRIRALAPQHPEWKTQQPFAAVLSGGGIEFMRPWTERVYGIPPQQVVGGSGKLEYALRDERPAIIKLPEVDFIDDKAGKPAGIQRHIGRRPIAAFGNSDGDLQMLQWTCIDRTPSLWLFVHHTDAEREFAYDRASSVGRLDQGLDEARARGWVVVDMKQDWKRVHPHQDR